MDQVRKNLNVSDITYKIIPDNLEIIESSFRELISQDVDLIISTGGTGPSPKDVTPEATLKVVEKRFYGLEIVMLLEGMKKTPEAAYSRAVVGSCRNTLIINLPGNPRAITENLPVLFPLIPHLILEIKGLKGHHNESS